jgi:hypothetical protein
MVVKVLSSLYLVLTQLMLVVEAVLGILMELQGCLEEAVELEEAVQEEVTFYTQQVLELQIEDQVAAVQIIKELMVVVVQALSLFDMNCFKVH